jgi:tetratricopeptide (TPR) repeat protein
MTTPTIAYRRDLAVHSHAFGERDGGWLVVATLLENAARAEPKQRRRLIDAAAKQARRTLGLARARRMAAFHWNGTLESPFDAIFLLAYTAEQADALNIADAIVGNALRAGDEMPVVQRGRLLSLHGRYAYKMGSIELAEDRLRAVDRLGRANRIAELQGRAALALGTVAQVRGNFPLGEQLGRRAARMGERAGIAWLERRARYGLVTVAARRKQYDRALAEAWRMSRLSEDDPIMRASDQQCLGELLLHMGEIDAARSLLSQALAMPLPAMILLPALGGFAIASARANDEAGLDWVVSQLRPLGAAMTPRYLYAQLLVECAEALAISGRQKDASQWRDKAIDLSRQYRFHELSFRAEAIELRPAPARPPRDAPRWAPAVQRIIRSVRSADAVHLPARVELAPANAD